MLFLNFILYLIDSSKYIVVLTRNGLMAYFLLFIQFPFKFFFFPITSTIKKKKIHLNLLLSRIKLKPKNIISLIIKKHALSFTPI